MVLRESGSIFANVLDSHQVCAKYEAHRALVRLFVLTYSSAS